MNKAKLVVARTLAVVILGGALLRAGAQPPPVRIMPVGDSITYGSPVPGGYRFRLYQLLTNAGYNVDFVGTQTGNPTNGLPDPDHEGHGGWTIRQIDSIMLGVFEQIDDPDVILVLIGTNDFGKGDDVTNAIHRLDALALKMAIARPYAKIVLANLLVRGEPQNTQIQTLFNPYVPGVASNHAALGREVYFDNLRSAVPLTNMPDNLHPNAMGYAQMATNWFAAITNLVSPYGSTNPPGLSRVRGLPGWTNVAVTFSKPVDPADATNLANYALSGGLTALVASLSADQRVVTLTTTPQAPNATYTATVSGVRDVTPAQRPIAPGSALAFRSEPLRGAFANVPEATDYTLMYSLDIPLLPNYSNAAPAYAYDAHLGAGPFDRVAYYLELETAAGGLQWVWASMDAFTADAGKIGVPTLASGAFFRQAVSNLNVTSSVPAIVCGTSLPGGNLEFWPGNYNQTNTLPVPGASSTLYDFGDNPAAGTYGSMQVHNHDASQTLFAFNRWGGAGGTADLGIGNSPSNTDWTFAQNAGDYTVRSLQVLVRGTGSDTNPPALLGAGTKGTFSNVVLRFSEPLADDATNAAQYALSGGATVLGAELDTATKTLVTLLTSLLQMETAYTVTVNGVTDRSTNHNAIAADSRATFLSSPLPGVYNNVPEAAAWTMVYALDLPTSASYGVTSPAYRVDNHVAVTGFSRVAYYLELQPTSGPRQYVWAEMDPFTPDAGKIGMPTVASGALFQQYVTNLTVRSSVGGMLNGTNMYGGFIEFWPWNYSANNAAGVPNASDTLYDWGDLCATNSGGHGSMQVHNVDAPEVVFAINRWGVGGTMAVGIGNNTNSANPDWTFADNAGAYTSRRLQVFVLPPADTVPPALAGATGSPRRDRITVAFSEPLADGAETPANYRLSGGLAVLGGTLSADRREVELITTPQQLLVTYTVTVNNVRDRSANANVIAPDSVAVVAPYSFAPPARILAHVPEAANYQLLQHLAIPTTSPGWNVGGTVYNTDHRRYFGPFTRVAYYLELATNASAGVTNWIWVSMDAFTSDVNYLGVPDMAAGVRYQQKVTNLNILSSQPGIVTGNGINTGNLEFWGQNYSGANALSIPNATANWDWGDVMGATFGTSGYGSMQVHNHGAGGTGQVLFAYNHWGDAGATACLGIGNRPNHPTNDWTFADNAAQYPVKNLYVLILSPADTSAPVIARALPSANQTNLLVRFDEPVLGAAVSNFTLGGGRTVDAAEFQANLRDVKLTVSPAMTPGASYTLVASGLADRSTNMNVGAATATVAALDLPVYARVPEAAGFELAYHLAIPTLSPNYNSNNIVYDLDYRPIHALAPFRRIAYYLELATSAGGATNWIYTSMETTSTNINRIGVPVLGTGAGFQQKLTNLNVLSSVAGIVTGNGIQTGNLEFWPLNYGGATNTVIPTGTSGFDWNDTYSTAGQYGSMQVHNYAASTTGQVLWAFNRWGGNFVGGSNDVGIGTRPAATSMDWTQLQNAGTQVVKNLTILAMPTNLVVPAQVLPPFAPMFVRQPLSRTNLAGETATLAAEADGTPIIGYQWRRNGTPLPGETNAWLVRASLAPAQAGDYDVLASNAVGSATSLVAALTVIVPEPPELPLASPPQVTGGNLTLSLTGTPGQVYAIQANSHLVTQTWSTVTNITAPPNGLFQFVEPTGAFRQRHYRTLSP